MRTFLIVLSVSLLACGGAQLPEDETPRDEALSTDAGVVEVEAEADEREPEDPPDAGEESSIDEAPDAGLVVADAGVAIDAGTPAPPDHRPFRVMSWNVRGPLDTGTHAWPNRRADVIALIKRQAPDVLGVQEAMVTNGEDLPADLIAGLQADYGYYRPAGGSPKIIFYKKARFTRFAQGNQSLPNPYASSHVCSARSSGKKLAWAKLRDRVTGREYFFGNTHLAFSEACGLGRLRQAEEIKRLVDSLAGALPVILAGDFNTDDQKPSLANEGVVEVLEGTGRALFRTARHDGNTGPDDATFNSRWNGSGTNNARLDFIFHSGCELTSSAPGVDRWPGTDTGTPSDHFPVLATIRGAHFEPGSTLVQVNGGESDDTQLFFADVDGDGCADQLSWSATTGNGSTWWARSRCTGTFAAPAQMGGATSGVASTRFFFADLTGDGCAEKIYWRPTYDGGRVRVYRGRCDGSFDAVVIADVPASTSEATRLFFARIDADACADLVRWNAAESAGRLTVYRSGCDGTFGDAITAAAGAQTTAGTQLWFADVDGDGLDDAIAWHPQVSSGQTRVFRSKGDGTFATLFTHGAGSSGVDTSRFFFADVDGDRRADKLFWRPGFRNGRVQIYPGTGTNFASSPVMDNTGWSRSERTQLRFADTDGDGAADKTYWNPGANGGAGKVFRARH